MKNKILIIFLFASSLLANEFETYLKSHNQSFQSYKQTLQKEFDNYKKAYDTEFKKYKQNILRHWQIAETSTNHKWIQYSKDYLSKKQVDFANQNITLETFAKNEDEARKKFEKLFDELLEETVQSAYSKDQLENAISKRLKIKSNIQSKQTIINDILDKNTKKKFISNLKNIPLKKVKHKNKFIYSANLKFPPKSLIKKAKLYKQDVFKQSTKTGIPENLIYAIIHSESSFNPMARSHIPAFGLMQIVPKSAGVDSYYFLYGKKKVLPSSYLYDSKNNIKIGSTYLQILDTKYLKNIKDNKSRWYCVIAAYNTGAGNVAKSFTGNTNIENAARKINTMTSQEVYKKLMRNLPYMETRKYLKKVNDRSYMYANLLISEI